MNGADYLKLVEEKQQVKGQRALGRELRVTHRAIAKIQSGGGMSEELAERVGRITGIDPAIILLDLAAEKASGPIRSRMHKMVEAIRNNAIVFTVILSVLIFSSFPVSSMAYETSKSNINIHYDYKKCNIYFHSLKNNICSTMFNEYE